MFSVEIRQDATARVVPLVVVPGSPRHDTGGNPPVGKNADGQDELPRERLGELPTYWPDEELADSLWGRILEDAQRGNLLGESPESWSPLGGPPDPETLAQLRQTARLEDEADARAGLARGGGIFIGRDDQRLLLPEIGILDDDGEPLGAVVFGATCCVAVLPAGTEEFRVDYLPTDIEELAEHAAAHQALAAYGQGDVYQMILWRTYFGTNTHITDAISGLGQWVKSSARSITERGGVLIGRIFHAKAHPKKFMRDITRHKRLIKALNDDPEFAYRCPDLPDIQDATGKIVIVVHGTMACGVSLARDIKNILGEDTPVGRFEHDTWLPVAHNAQELVELLNVLSAEQVTLIAHSRGGLVATLAAAKTTHKDVRVIALGTPFRGTPLAHAGELPILGYRSLLGVARGLGGGFPPISLATRLAGFLVKEVPKGIAEMEPGWRTSFIGPPPKLVAALCGNLTEETMKSKDSYGFHALVGVSRGAFNGDDNDLVVSTASANGDHPSPTVVDCDHFSYLAEDVVADVIEKFVDKAAGRFQFRPSWYGLPRPGPTRV